MITTSHALFVVRRVCYHNADTNKAATGAGAVGAGMGSAHKDVAVGLPKAGTAMAQTEYTDTHVKTRDLEHPVTAVESKREAGQDIGMKVRTTVAKSMPLSGQLRLRGTLLRWRRPRLRRWILRVRAPCVQLVHARGYTACSHVAACACWSSVMTWTAW